MDIERIQQISDSIDRQRIEDAKQLVESLKQEQLLDEQERDLRDEWFFQNVIESIETNALWAAEHGMRNSEVMRFGDDRDERGQPMPGYFSSAGYFRAKRVFPRVVEWCRQNLGPSIKVEVYSRSFKGSINIKW